MSSIEGGKESKSYAPSIDRFVNNKEKKGTNLFRVDEGLQKKGALNIDVCYVMSCCFFFACADVSYQTHQLVFPPQKFLYVY